MRPFDPRLLRELPAARMPVAGLAAVGVAQGALTVAQAFAVGATVVAVTRSEPLTTPLAMLVGVLAARATLTAVGELVASHAGTRVSTALRRAVLATWLDRSADDRPAPDRALTLATQGATAVEPYVARYLPTLVAATVLPVLAIGALLLVDGWSALICLLTLPLLPVFAALIGMTTADASARRWAAMTTLAGHYLDTVRGLPTLVAYGRADRQAGRLRDVSDRHRLATVATLRLAFLSSAALELLATISVALVAVSVGIRLTWGTIELGPAVTAIMLAPEAYWPVRRVGQEFHNAADGAQALDALLDEAGSPSDAPAPAVAPIAAGDATTAPAGGAWPRLDDVTYRYPGSPEPVVTHLDLEAAPGLTAVTGPSGSGKTTMLELLAGLRRPESGTGGDRRVHVVTQRPFIPAGSLLDAVTLGTGVGRAEALEALTRVGLGDVVTALPDGLDTLLGDDGFGLSAGQRARVGIARALLGEAPVIALDEPTAHLDAESAALVNAVLRAVADTRPVVVVTHRPELVEIADRHVEVTR